jgi:hypothetical protein
MLRVSPLAALGEPTLDELEIALEVDGDDVGGLELSDQQAGALDALEEVGVVLRDDGEGVLDPLQSLLTVEYFRAHHPEFVVGKVQMTQDFLILAMNCLVPHDRVPCTQGLSVEGLADAVACCRTQRYTR